MKLYCVRHGATSWSDGVRYTGLSNPPLTAAGERQAQALGAWLRGSDFDIAVVSPLDRCQTTYARMAPALGSVGSVRVDARVREIDYGDWEGRTRDELLAADPRAFAGWDEDPTRHGPPGGESVAAVAARVAELVAELVAAGHGRALVVSHRTVLRVLVAQALGIPLRTYRARLDHMPGALTVLDMAGPENGKLLLYNAAPDRLP